MVAAPTAVGQAPAASLAGRDHEGSQYQLGIDPVTHSNAVGVDGEPTDNSIPVVGAATTP